MITYTLKVVELYKKTKDVVTICFKQPSLKKIKYKAGQYLTLIVRVNGRKYIRPYSFSSAPELDKYLEITIKRMPGGIVSNYLYDHIKIDDIIEAMEPMGEFIYDANTIQANNIMLWGAGSGITPLMSILKTVLYKSPEKKVNLFYCNRDSESTIFCQDILDIAGKYSNLTVHNFYTRIPENVYFNYHIIGRIDEDKIIDILSDNESLGDSIHYICGPTGLKQSVKNALKSLKISSLNILTEEFEILIDPKDFNDIETQMISMSNGIDNWNFEVTKGTSILNAGLDRLIDLPYSCQTGTCMLCKAKLISGNVKVIGIGYLPEELATDDCLLCCSYPYSNDVEILVN